MSRVTLPLLATITLLGLPATARAQEAEAGTAVMLMRVSLPDSASPLPQAGLDEMAMRMTYATDGQRVAMQMQFEPTQSAMGFPLDEILLHLIWEPTTDSIRLGITLPLDLMAQLGGGAGFAFAFELPDSLALPVALGDSVEAAMARMNFSYRDLGTTATVAGVTCREYEMMNDSVPATVCLAKPPAALAAVNRMMERLPLVGTALQAITARQREMFGSDDNFTIRMASAMPGGGSVHMELASFTSGTPDISFFTLSPELGPLPPELMAAIKQGVASATEIPDQP